MRRAAALEYPCVRFYIHASEADVTALRRVPSARYVTPAVADEMKLLTPAVNCCFADIHRLSRPMTMVT